MHISIQEANMGRISVFVVVGLLATLLVCRVSGAQTPAGAAANTLENPIRDCERQVASWRRGQNVEIVFLVLTLAVGAVISALQASKMRSVKPITVVLGIITAILTGVNGTVFPADVKTLGRAIVDGDAVIRQLWVKLGFLQSGQLTGADLKAARDAFATELGRFQTVADTLTGSTVPTKTTTSRNETPDLLPVVYAQAPSWLPDWTRKIPAETAKGLYFVGRAVDPSLAVAKQNSPDAALYNAAQALIVTAPSVSPSALLDLIKASAVTQDSAFAYDGNRKAYEYYTLLRLNPQIRELVTVLPAASASPMTVFRQKDWRPSDLTSNPTSGLFVLDRSGTVYALQTDEQGQGAIKKLFQIGASESGYAVTATIDAVLVAATSRIGCTIYRYSLVTKAVSTRAMGVRERCFGIASDGNAVYVTFPEKKELRYWDNWAAASLHSWSLDELRSPGSMWFDDPGHRLVVADDVGESAYAVSIPDGKTHLLSGNLGAVQSIATSRFHLLLASGKKVLFLSRFDNHGENPPTGWPVLPGGHIVGVAVDASDKLWVADFDNKLVEGPLPLINSAAIDNRLSGN
jgi:hypothetical protein